MIRTKRMVCLAILIVLLSSYITGCGSDKHLFDSTILITDLAGAYAEAEVLDNPCPTLSVPTQVNKIGDTYFIVDCYDDQVIYSDDVKAPLYEWKVLTSDMSRGHTIASDGVVYLVDDTENNRVLVFEKYEDKFLQTQVLDGIGLRPHYVIYNEENKTFYVWSSMTGQMYLMKRDVANNQVYVSDILSIDELNGVYVRSFTIIGNDIYFVSGNCQIIRAKLSNFKINKRYVVPVELAGMVQIMPVDGGFLITISTDANGDQSYATIIFTKDLEKLSDYEYEDVYDNFVGGGTPYYITHIEDTYYLTEHRVPGHSVWSFKVSDGQITDVESIQ